MSDRPSVRAPFKPSQLILLVGILLAGGTVLSGILGTADGWRDPSPIARDTFTNVPSAVKLGFYTLLPLLFIWAAWQLSLRARNWERGAPDKRLTDRFRFRKRADSYRRGVYMQTLLRDPAAGLMHSLIYFPFLTLFAVTNVLLINEQLPSSAKMVLPIEISRCSPS